MAEAWYVASAWIPVCVLEFDEDGRKNGLEIGGGGHAERRLGAKRRATRTQQRQRE